MLQVLQKKVQWEYSHMARCHQGKAGGRRSDHRGILRTLCCVCCVCCACCVPCAVCVFTIATNNTNVAFFISFFLSFFLSCFLSFLLPLLLPLPIRHATTQDPRVSCDAATIDAIIANGTNGTNGANGVRRGDATFGSIAGALLEVAGGVGSRWDLISPSLVNLAVLLVDAAGSVGSVADAAVAVPWPYEGEGWHVALAAARAPPAACMAALGCDILWTSFIHHKHARAGTTKRGRRRDNITYMSNDREHALADTVAVECAHHSIHLSLCTPLYATRCHCATI